MFVIISAILLLLQLLPISTSPLGSAGFFWKPKHERSVTAEESPIDNHAERILYRPKSGGQALEQGDQSASIFGGFFIKPRIPAGIKKRDARETQQLQNTATGLKPSGALKKFAVNEGVDDSAEDAEAELSFKPKVLLKKRAVEDGTEGSGEDSAAGFFFRPRFGGFGKRSIPNTEGKQKYPL